MQGKKGRLWHLGGAWSLWPLNQPMKGEGKGKRIMVESGEGRKRRRDRGRKRGREREGGRKSLRNV